MRHGYEIESELFNDTFWIIPDNLSTQELRTSGINGTIYTEHEMTELMKLPKQNRLSVHQLKKAFFDSEAKVKKANIFTRNGVPDECQHRHRPGLYDSCKLEDNRPRIDAMKKLFTVETKN